MADENREGRPGLDNGRRPKLLSIPELCEYFGCSRRAFYSWIEKGFLPAPAKPFGQRRWLMADIEAHWRKLNISLTSIADKSPCDTCDVPLSKRRC